MNFFLRSRRISETVEELNDFGRSERFFWFTVTKLKLILKKKTLKLCEKVLNITTITFPGTKINIKSKLRIDCIMLNQRSNFQNRYLVQIFEILIINWKL